MAKQGWSLEIIKGGPTLQPWINSLNRLEREPSANTMVQIKAVMDQAYAAAQANVHVAANRKNYEGGRLRASLNMPDLDHRTSIRTNRVTGRMGIGKGVPHAHWELTPGKGRKGPIREDWLNHPSHDPFSGLSVFYGEMDLVMKGIGF